MKKMFKRVFALAAVGAAGVLLLTGCGSAEEKFIGDWYSVRTTLGGRTVDFDIRKTDCGVNFEIKDNGKAKYMVTSSDDTNVFEGEWNVDEEDDDVIHFAIKGKDAKMFKFKYEEDDKLIHEAGTDGGTIITEFERG